MRHWFATSLIITLLLGLGLSVTTAQDGSTPVITAEVIYEGVNLRIGPSVRYESLSVLPRGTPLTVIARREESVWVYATADSFGLTGWIASQYLYFSDREWSRVLPVMPYQEILTTFPAEALQPPFTMSIWRNGSSVKLLEHPRDSAPVIAQLESWTTVIVIGRSGRVSNYIYIQVPTSGLEGWVHYSGLFPDRHNMPASYNWPMTLPVMAEPFPLEGQTLATLQSWQPLHLRTLPAFDAPIITLLDSGIRLSVHGRSSDDPNRWIYVTVVDMGLSGWVFDGMFEGFIQGYPSINYPQGFDRNSLPILPAVEQPPLLPPLEIISSISATTRINIGLYYRYYPIYYRRHAVPLIVIPAGTTLTLTGRTDDNDLFRTTYAGQEGWVRFRALDFQGGDFNRLPIID